MPRSASIVGLLLQLAALHVRRTACVIAAVALIVVLVATHRTDAPSPGALQAAVLRDGFVVTDLSASGRRVRELAPDGTQRRELALSHADDRRVVGARRGTHIAWQDGSKLRLALIDDEQTTTTWGKAVRHLCDGVASNDTRFGVGWLEADDTVWMVHGPVAANGAAEADEPVATHIGLARTEWCGLASAEHKVAMLWRTADRLRLTMCTQKSCSEFPATFKLDRQVALLGFGCLRDACLVAGREPAGRVLLAYVTDTGRSKWSKVLDGDASRISIVGAGDRAFAVGRTTRAGAEVVRFDRSGAATPVWRDPAATSPPTLAWSSGRLLIARYHGDELVSDSIALPR